MSNQQQQTHTARRNLSDFDMRDNGFDTIRLIAAIAVILSHAFPLTGISEPLATLTYGQISLGNLAVSIFFLISGYLIPASLDRGTLSRYSIKRAFRIMPALVVAVLLCAFALGPVMTSMPLSAYLTAIETWKFVGNALMLPVGYGLPGVFGDTPNPSVNGSLWSLKYEAACYIIVPIVFAIWRKPLLIAAWLASFVIAYAIPYGSGGALFMLDLLAQLFRFFGMGMLFYVYARYVPMRLSWAIAALALCLAAIFTPLLVEVIAIAGSYAIIYFAYHCPQSFRNITARGDISYGVYVYAFPIQQLMVPLSMGFAIGGVAAPWLANFALALPLSLLAGLVSWLLVEKPFLSLGRDLAARTKAA